MRTQPGGDPGQRGSEELEQWSDEPPPTPRDWFNPGDDPDGDDQGWADDGPSGSAGGSGGGHRPSRPVRSRGHHPVLITLAVVIVVFLIAAGLVLDWAHHQIDPGGKPGPAVTVVIPAGASTAKIGSILSSHHVIHSSTVFDIYVKLKGSGSFEAGTYTLRTDERYDTVISALEQGPPQVVEKLVVPEGFTLKDIAQRVGRLPGHSAAHFLAVADSGQVRSPYEPAGTNDLEGLVYPATYNVSPDEDDATILQQMVQTFDNVATNIGLATGAAKLKLTPYQVVTVASMVEREAKLEQDRGPIASVIYNRLAAGVPLGVDSTLLYGLGITNPAKLNFNSTSPYNTRKYTGLPPTPIANPGTPSLEAALHPPSTSYMYYVLIDKDGKTGFATTLAQFQVLEAECQSKGLC